MTEASTGVLKQCQVCGVLGHNKRACPIAEHRICDECGVKSTHPFHIPKSKICYENQHAREDKEKSLLLDLQKQLIKDKANIKLQEAIASLASNPVLTLTQAVKKFKIKKEVLIRYIWNVLGSETYQEWKHRDPSEFDAFCNSAKRLQKDTPEEMRFFTVLPKFRIAPRKPKNVGYTPAGGGFRIFKSALIDDDEMWGAGLNLTENADDCEEISFDEEVQLNNQRENHLQEEKTSLKKEALALIRKLRKLGMVFPRNSYLEIDVAGRIEVIREKKVADHGN